MLKGGGGVFPVIGSVPGKSCNPAHGPSDPDRTPAKGGNPLINDHDPVANPSELLNAGVVFIHIPAVGA